VSEIIRFPARQGARIWLMREGAAWLVVARGHGWLHGNYNDAFSDAVWLAENLGLAVRKHVEPDYPS